VGILVGVLTLVILFLLYKRKFAARGRSVALAGVCESGKTAMFAKLLHGKGVETYTSTKDNRGMAISVMVQANFDLVRPVFR